MIRTTSFITMIISILVIILLGSSVFAAEPGKYIPDERFLDILPNTTVYSKDDVAISWSYRDVGPGFLDGRSYEVTLKIMNGNPNDVQFVLRNLSIKGTTAGICDNDSVGALVFRVKPDEEKTIIAPIRNCSGIGGSNSPGKAFVQANIQVLSDNKKEGKTVRESVKKNWTAVCHERDSFWKSVSTLTTRISLENGKLTIQSEKHTVFQPPNSDEHLKGDPAVIDVDNIVRGEMHQGRTGASASCSTLRLFTRSGKEHWIGIGDSGSGDALAHDIINTLNLPLK